MTLPDPGLLTEDEHRAVEMAGELWNLLCRIVGQGASRGGDLNEFIHLVHGIQRGVLKQAAARAYPNQYRLLGEMLPAPETESVMTLPLGGLPDGPVEAILAWCAGDRERLEVAYSVELKSATSRAEVTSALEQALMRIGYFGQQAAERAE